MESMAGRKAHAVCVPYPAQGHITPMLKLAKILHSRGFHVTFVNTHHNHARLLRSRGPSSLDALPDFRFESIPDGLPLSDLDVTQDIPSLCESTQRNCLGPLRCLLARLNTPSSGVPPVTCLVADLGMHFAIEAAEELRVPTVFLNTINACSYMAILHFEDLLRRGIIPIKDVGDLERVEFMEREVEGIAGLEGIRFKDLPSFVRTTDPGDVILNFLVSHVGSAKRCSAIVFNTFDDLERPVLDAMSGILPPVFSVGPLSLLCNQIPPSPQLTSLGSNLWQEDPSCLEWLEGKPPASVVYVNFGSITVMTMEQLVEFAWGLANSEHEFLWVIRPDLVRGDQSAVLPEDFAEATKERGLLASWCAQEEVLSHPAVGGFLTHCGWNSILESISAGVPMVCWPFFADQQTNCRYSCREWGIGVDLDSNVKRGEVEVVIRELMGGEKGRKMKERASKWKDMAIAATLQGGSSYENFARLLGEVRLP